MQNLFLLEFLVPSGGYVLAEEHAASEIGSPTSTVPSVTSSVYDELFTNLSASLDPEEIITISSVVERFLVDRSWVTAELVKGYKLSDIYQGLLFQEKGGEYQIYMDRLYPDLPLDPLTAFNKQSLAVTSAVYDDLAPDIEVQEVYPISVTENVYSRLMQAAASGTGYDDVALKRQPLRFDQAPYVSVQCKIKFPPLTDHYKSR
ncbi:hypothetical protein [Paenibacillus ihumii]|uniref:hypothetical protein n=1 Tax=Paenibacillus ihumii TaxID=687436 RepID=UPI001CA33BC0|nr:hypothetical protein [Paenibacillus ihumii]